MSLWNLFNRRGGKEGTAEGSTREEIERIAREHLGRDVTAETVESPTKQPCRAPSGGMGGKPLKHDPRRGNDG